MNNGRRYQEAYEQFLQGEIGLFYKEVYPSLLVFTRRLLPKSLVYLAEDCVQDAIFKLYSQRSGMASSEHAKSFLYICIHNVVVSYIRKDNSRQHFIQQDNDNFEDDFSVELIRQETIDELMGAVDRLPDDMRQLCEMIFRENGGDSPATQDDGERREEKETATARPPQKVAVSGGVVRCINDDL